MTPGPIIDIPVKPVELTKGDPALPVAGLPEGVVVFSLEHVPDDWPWWMWCRDISAAVVTW